MIEFLTEKDLPAINKALNDWKNVEIQRIQGFFICLMIYISARVIEKKEIARS